MRDAEAMLRAARSPLVLGMGGGGDVVGALATAEFARLYDGASPVLGGLSWERRVIDPVPGSRRAEEIEGGRQLAEGVMLADGGTRVRGRDVVFAESRMAQFLGQETVLVDVGVGPSLVAQGLGRTVERLGSDLIVFIDVGGDVLAQGEEPGLTSPLCDSVMLASAARLARAGYPVLAGIFGTGCDGELTPAEVLSRIAQVATAGGLCGARGLTEAVAERVEQVAALIPTEASAKAVQAFRGASGPVSIRGGAKSLELTSIASLTLYLDVPVMYEKTGRLAQAVNAVSTLDEANEALHRLGVRTELDYEREAAAGAAGRTGFLGE